MKSNHIKIFALNDRKKCRNPAGEVGKLATKRALLVSRLEQRANYVTGQTD